MAKHTQTIRVFGHFFNLALKGLILEGNFGDGP